MLRITWAFLSHSCYFLLSFLPSGSTFFLTNTANLSPQVENIFPINFYEGRICLGYLSLTYKKEGSGTWTVPASAVGTWAAPRRGVGWLNPAKQADGQHQRDPTALLPVSEADFSRAAQISPVLWLGQCSGLAWPGKGLQLPLVRQLDFCYSRAKLRLPHCWVITDARFIPALSAGRPNRAFQERRGCNTGQPKPTERHEKRAVSPFAACMHQKAPRHAAGKRILLLGNIRAKRGIDTYQVHRKIAQLFSVLGSRAINSTCSGAIWGILNTTQYTISGNLTQRRYEIH